MTTLPSDGVVEMAKQFLALRGSEQKRLERISKYVRNKHDPIYTPKGASTEYRWLARKCHHNFLPLVVAVVSNNLHVDGYRPTGALTTDTASSPDDDPVWSAFRANRMISRQHGVFRAVAKYGCGYVTVLPGTMGNPDIPNSVPVVRPVSPRRLTALYADEVDDEWPQFSVEEKLIADRTAPGKQRRLVTVMDDTNRYILTTEGDSTRTLDFAQADDPLLNGKQAIMAHGMGLCPVVRFTSESDLDGETDCSGEVEPLIEIQDGINFDTFNLMLAEQFAAYRQRYISGMSPVDEEGRPTRPFDPGVDRVWTAEDATTKFGEFDVTPLQPYLDTREAGIRHMAIIAQVPSYALLGALINLSGDAMAAARDGLDRKIEELQSTLTDPARNVFRLIGKAQDDTDTWDDLTGTIVWRDTSARAFAATIDGLGKAAQMLGVPVTELWRRIPGVTADDVNAWIAATEQKDALAELDKIYEAALTGGTLGQNPNAQQPYQAGNVGAAPVGGPPPAAAPGAPAAQGGSGTPQKAPGGPTPSPKA